MEEVSYNDEVESMQNGANGMACDPASKDELDVAELDRIEEEYRRRKLSEKEGVQAQNSGAVAEKSADDGELDDELLLAAVAELEASAGVSERAVMPEADGPTIPGDQSRPLVNRAAGHIALQTAPLGNNAAGHNPVQRNQQTRTGLIHGDDTAGDIVGQSDEIQVDHAVTRKTSDVRESVHAAAAKRPQSQSQGPGEHRSRQSSITKFFGTNSRPDDDVWRPGAQSETVRSASLRWRPYTDENLWVEECAPDEETSAWIYPSNLPEREYQFEMVKSCLVANTLVCLPTGLGKTLIAAVVIYNFHRWFPKGKIAFVAPTRPLVRQQIQACYDVTGIPSDKTVEFTGAVPQLKRRTLWQEKQIFFLTPQVVNNDLLKSECAADKFVLVVVDEAHRATGNYAYCTLVTRIMEATDGACRIVGLTATPGSNMKFIQEVIDNLRCSVLDYRDEADEDVKKYLNRRNVETITVELGADISDVREDAVAMLKLRVSRLTAVRAIRVPNDYYNLPPYTFIAQRKTWRANAQDLRPAERSRIEKMFLQCITLCYGISVLYSHGLVVFDKFLQQQVDEVETKKATWKAELVRSSEFSIMHEKVKLLVEQGVGRDQRQICASWPVSNKSNGQLTMFTPCCPYCQESHPKQKECEQCLLTHFRTNEERDGSRVIVFVEYRESVAELQRVLSKHEPLVRVASFVGQSVKSAGGKGETDNDASKSVAAQGMNQKAQNKALRSFRAGSYNTLLSTSIGEEGLDIGEVDLIIMYDALRSPVRMVQRMGRTGRRRDGRVVVLLTDGAEESKYRSGTQSSEYLKSKMRSDNFRMYSRSARMLKPSVRKVSCRRVRLSIAQITFFRGEEELSQLARQNKELKDKKSPTAILKALGLDSRPFARCARVASLLRTAIAAFPSSVRVPSPAGSIRHSAQSSMLVNLMQRMDEIEANAGKSNGSRPRSMHAPGSSRRHSVLDVFPALAATDECSEHATDREQQAEHVPATDSSQEADGLHAGVLEPPDGTQSTAEIVPADSASGDFISKDDVDEVNDQGVIGHERREQSTMDLVDEDVRHDDGNHGDQLLPADDIDDAKDDNTAGSDDFQSQLEETTDLVGKMPSPTGIPDMRQHTAVRKPRKRLRSRLIDDEADASDESDEADEDSTGSLAGFIVNTQSQETERSTPRRESSGQKSEETPTRMYRRSLLTQQNGGFPTPQRRKAKSSSARRLQERIDLLEQQIAVKPRARHRPSKVSNEEADEDEPIVRPKKRLVKRNIFGGRNATKSSGTVNVSDHSEDEVGDAGPSRQPLETSPAAPTTTVDDRKESDDAVRRDNVPTKLQEGEANKEDEAERQRILDRLLPLKSKLLMSKAQQLWEPRRVTEALSVSVIVSTRLVSSPAVRELSTRSMRVRLLFLKLVGEDFVCGVNTVVIKRSVAEISKSGEAGQAFLNTIALLRRKYRKLVVIIQGEPRNGARSTHLRSVLVSLAHPQREFEGVVRVETYDTVEGISQAVQRIAQGEEREGQGLNWMPDAEHLTSIYQAAQFFEAAPLVSWPSAISICTTFRCVRDVVQASESELCAKARGLSVPAAQNLVANLTRPCLRL